MEETSVTPQGETPQGETVDRSLSFWSGLAWEKKVAICEQGRANENNLLQSYRVIFLAFETTLLVIAFTTIKGGWGGFWVL